MCGRTALTATPEDVREAFGLDRVPDLAPRYNVAPSQAMAVVRVPGMLELLSWGLVPFWARDRKIAHKLALARTESVLTAPAFRGAIRERRCLVVVTGFYEWQRAGTRGSMPFLIARADGKPFALAGLWERWVSKDKEMIESCAILTQPARAPFDAVHNRMPVVLARDTWAGWLDPRARDVNVAALLEAPAPALLVRAVGPYVNDPRHDGPECQRRSEPAQGQLFAAFALSSTGSSEPLSPCPDASSFARLG